MPYKPVRHCKRPGCTRVISYPLTVCEDHRGPKREEHRPSSHARGYDATWRALRMMVLREFPVCKCGQPASEVDHIIPKARGGTNALKNLQAMCKPCHSRKTAHEDSKFLSKG